MNTFKGNEFKNIGGNTQTSPNRSIYASPPEGRLGLRSPRSFRYAPFPRLTAPQFAVAGLCYAKPLYATANRHIQPERYA